MTNLILLGFILCRNTNSPVGSHQCAARAEKWAISSGEIVLGPALVVERAEGRGREEEREGVGEVDRARVEDGVVRVKDGEGCGEKVPELGWCEGGAGEAERVRPERTRWEVKRSLLVLAILQLLVVRVCCAERGNEGSARARRSPPVRSPARPAAQSARPNRRSPHRSASSTAQR